MREIKFRAWNVETKEMLPVSDLSFWADKDGKDGLDIGIRNDESVDPIYGDPNTETIPMQYTGLKDKNGKEIYEGDIIRTSSDPNNWNKSTDGIHKVEFWNGQFVFNALRDKDDDYINFGWWVRSNNNTNILHQIEVIGNIYENPKLVEVSNDQ